MDLCEKYDISLIDMRFVKPLDEALVRSLAESHDYLVSIEEGAIEGGIGEAIAHLVISSRLNATVFCKGIPDRFIMEDSRRGILHDLELDAEGIESFIKSLI